MSAPAHSPGPFSTRPGGSPARILAADGDCIAMVYLGDGRKRTERHQANAQMFLASPAMLAALIKVRDEIAAHWTRDELAAEACGMEVALDQVEVAIAAAQRV